MTETNTDQSEYIEGGILDNALVMIAVLDNKGKIISWNRAAETITGYTRDEVVGSTAVWKHLYPDKNYRRSVTEKIAEILATKNYFENLETTIRTRSGDSRVILWNTQEIIREGITRAIAIGLDITHQKEMDAFRESVVDNANVLIAVLDRKGNVLIWNKAAESITGYSRAEVIGNRSVWQRLYPEAEYRRSITKRITDIITQNRYFENLETTIVTKKGDRRIISWNTKQIEAGGEHRAIAVGLDITHQKELDAFRESIINNANVLIAVLDPNGKVLVWNDAAESITGYSHDEVVGNRHVWKRLYPDAEYRRTITKKITDIISQHRFFENLETTIVTKKGDRRIISWNTKQIEAGDGHHEIAIGRDITEQRKAEEALLAYISEMAMRLKQPIGIIGDNLRDLASLIRDGKLTKDEIVMMLEGQVRNATQIASNVQELQMAIVEKHEAIPEAYRKFLKG